MIAIGNRIAVNNFDQWLEELDRISNDVHVQWVHLKFMLVDPLSQDPVVVTGSANFSEASTRTNDENMLVTKGNTRVADIYLGEYVRLYSHYAFREAVQIFLERNPGAKPQDMKQGFLVEDADWTAPYFDPNDKSARMARRLYFAGEAKRRAGRPISRSPAKWRSGWRRCSPACLRRRPRAGHRYLHRAFPRRRFACDAPR